MNDRLLDDIRAIVRAELARLSYLGSYLYRVTVTDGTTVDCVPVDTTGPLPALKALPLRGSVLGDTVAPSVGGTCVVRFVNADPGKPCVMGVSGTPKTSTVDAQDVLQLGPTAAKVTFASGSSGVARQGDAVTFWLPPGCTFSGGTITIQSAFNGLVGPASDRVGAG